MIKVIVCMKDVKSGFLSIQEDINRDSAIRNFKYAIRQAKKSDGMLYACPDDFELWQLGIIDNETGIIQPDLQFLSSARDHIDKEVKDEVSKSV